MAQIDLGSIKFNWKSTYSGVTAYVVDDVVEYNGSSYICIAATTGNAPPNATYWEQMSSAGTNGTDGTDLTTTLTTQGDIVYRDASGLQRLGAGTSGQLLQSGGAGANVSWTDAPSGKVKQTLTKSANQNFGSISNTNAYHLSGLDVTFTAQATDPYLFMSGEVLTDNSNSGNYGVDLGFEIVNNTDTVTKWAYKPNKHPMYVALSADIYFPCRKTILWDASGTVSHGSSASGSSGFITAGDSVTVKVYIRCNDSNMQYFGGNVTGQHPQWVQIWEIAQ